MSYECSNFRFQNHQMSRSPVEIRFTVFFHSEEVMGKFSWVAWKPAYIGRND